MGRERVRLTSSFSSTNQKAHRVYSLYILSPRTPERKDSPHKLHDREADVYGETGDVVACWDHEGAVWGPEYYGHVV